jgi:putative sterol carrier protein
MATFPSEEWTTAVMENLNSDEDYARIARNWEDDLKYIVEPSGSLPAQVILYFDLWHGKCRKTLYLADTNIEQSASFVLKASYDIFKRILEGELNPMQALLTRKVLVEGNLGLLIRSVPIVLNFVRCCREVTDQFI